MDKNDSNKEEMAQLLISNAFKENSLSRGECENTLRKPKVKLELGSHGERTLTNSSLIIACIVQQEDRRWPFAVNSKLPSPAANEKPPPLQTLISPNELL